MIIRISSFEDLLPYLLCLVDMYKDCFAEPPWNEFFTDEEVRDWFKKMLELPKNIVLLFKDDNGDVVGATFCFPVSFKEDVAKFLPKNFSPEKVCYLAEMFVNSKRRNNGVGTSLHHERLIIAKKEGFEAAIHRTNFNSKMFPLITKNGFDVIGSQDVSSYKSINGEIINAIDKRAISFKQF